MAILELLKTPKKYPQILLVLLSLFPVLNINALSILAFTFFVSSVFLNLKNIKNNFREKGYKHLLIHTAFYVVLIASLLYSPFKAKGLDVLIRQLSVLLMPLIIFYAIKISDRLIKLMTIIFIAANLLVVLYFIVRLNLIGDFISDPKMFFNTTYFIDIGIMESYKDWHPTYISINNLLASLVLLNYILKPKNSIKIKLFSVIVIGLFLVFSIILNSRVVFFLTLIILPLFVFVKLKTIKYRMGIILILVSFAFVLYKTSDSNKFGRIFEHPAQYYLDNFNAKTLLGVRYQVQKCSVELISRRPILGYGIGYEKKLLPAFCLETRNFTNKHLTKYSSHNVYLSLIFSAGLLALLTFVLMLINNLRIAIKKKDLLHLSILVIFILAFLTENYLIRLNGVLLFTFINSYFYYKNRLKIEDNT